MNSVNSGPVMRHRRAKARSIGSPKYEDLKLRKKKKKKKKSSGRRTTLKQSTGHMLHQCRVCVPVCVRKESSAMSTVTVQNGSVTIRSSDSAIIKNFLVYSIIISLMGESLRIVIARELDGNRRDCNTIEK